MTPRGISDILGYYAKAVGAAIGGLQNVSTELTIRYSNELKDNAAITEGTIGNVAGALGSANQTTNMFGLGWLKANSEYFDNLFP